MPKVVSAEIYTPLTLANIVSHTGVGEFKGKWSGYEVVFSSGVVQYRLRTAEGVRGLNIPCVVSVTSEGGISVEAKD